MDLHFDLNLNNKLELIHNNCMDHYNYCIAQLHVYAYVKPLLVTYISIVLSHISCTSLLASLIRQTAGPIFRGCLRQPLYCFQIDVFIWLHVTDIYIYIYK